MNNLFNYNPVIIKVILDDEVITSIMPLSYQRSELVCYNYISDKFIKLITTQAIPFNYTFILKSAVEAHGRLCYFCDYHSAYIP
jgi:hypothetical protein